MAMIISILAVVLFIASVGFSILGQGGGVLYTPIQVLLGVDFHTAATTSLFLIMTVSLSSTLVFRKAGKIDWPLAILMEVSTALGGFIGGLSSGRFSGNTLSILLSMVLVAAAFFMIRTFERSRPCTERANGFFAWHRRLNGQSYRVNLAVALPVSCAAGLVSGLIGIGGGVLKVPMMVLLLGIPMDIAVGSSAFMIGITASGGFAGHVMAGHWDWRTSLILAVVVFAGGQIGSRISIRLDKNRMKKGFGWFLLGIAVLMIIRIVLKQP
jgi:hypothetical protein